MLTSVSKIMQCAIARQDYTTALGAYEKMPESGKEEPITGFLMYKSSLRSGDTDSGRRIDL